MKRCVCLGLVLLGLVFSVGVQASTSTLGPTTSLLTTTSANPLNITDTTTASAATGKEESSTSASQPTPSATAEPMSTANANTTSPAATGGTEQATTGTAMDATTTANVTDSAVSSPESPATATNTTTAPAVVTTVPVSSDTSTPNSTAVLTTTPAQTPVPTASTAAAPASTSAPAATTDVVISETNLLLASEDLFVELKGAANKSLSGLTLAIFNATSAKESLRVDFNDTDTFLASGYFKNNVSTEVQIPQTVLIALYQSKDYKSSSPNKNIIDFVIFSTNSSAAVNPRLQEALLPNGTSVTLVKSGLIAPQSLSLSRCDSDAKKDHSLFVLAAPSAGESNACNLTMPNSTVWTLGLFRSSTVCNPDKAEDQEERAQVENHLVTLINQRCRCGLTTLLVEVVGNLTCIRNLYMDFKIKESYEGQTDKVICAFVSLARDRVNFTMHKEEYRVLNCTTNCAKYNPSILPPHSSSKDGTTMTVAVVLSCVCVFLIILVAVILYMRGRRRGIIRQFRMTRLQEDDDMDDMDDFIGGGGEASFSTRHR